MRSEETADLLAEKARIAEEEAILLTQKAAEAEAEVLRIKMAAIQTEEDKLLMERRAHDAELVAARIMDDYERRAKEADVLKDELVKAKVAEKSAKDKLHDIMGRRTPPPYPHVNMVNSSGVIQTYSSLTFDPLNGLSDLEDADLGVADTEVSCDLMSGTDINTLSLEMEKEKMEYLEKSKNLQEQLKELKSEIEVLKVEEKQSHLDLLHEENLQQGEAGKYQTMQKIKAGTTKARVAFFEEL